MQLAYEEQWCDFCLDDGTGLVLVRMLRPQVSADLEEASYSDHMVPPSAAQDRPASRRRRVSGMPVVDSGAMRKFPALGDQGTGS